MMPMLIMEARSTMAVSVEPVASAGKKKAKDQAAVKQRNKKRGKFISDLSEHY